MYKDGVIFAIIVNDQLYFKVDETNKSDYEKFGSKPFMYTGHNGKSYAMAYWEVPDEIIDDKAHLKQYLATSVATSVKGKKKK